MERVTFLAEENNQRLSCMLNPETLLLKRSSGVRPRESLSGPVESGNRGDNPLLFTGGGHTILELDLVFDVSIPGSSIVTKDVRDLTKPIWDLSENYQRSDRRHRPALCRFIWGKCWNIPGVVSAVAERLESFTPEGIPRRSWLRLRLLRMQQQPQSSLRENEFWPTSETRTGTTMSGSSNLPAGGQSPDTQAGFGTAVPDITENSAERIDLYSFHTTGDPANWRETATVFNLADPLRWLENFLPEYNRLPEN